MPENPSGDNETVSFLIAFYLPFRNPTFAGALKKLKIHIESIIQPRRTYDGPCIPYAYFHNISLCPCAKFNEKRSFSNLPFRKLCCFFLKLVGLMDEHLSYLDKYMSGLKPYAVYSKCMFQTNQQYLKNIVHLRGIYLTRLFNSDKNGFSETPTIDHLLLSIYKNPVRPFYKFSAMFSQFFMKTLLEIQKTPDAFIDAVIRQLSSDNSFIIPFAYSAFPALFSYFSTQDFIFLGSNFLKQFIYKSHCYEIVAELINSFFTSCTVFYEKLWNVLSDSLSQPLVNKKEEFQNILSSALRLTCQKLTKQHCEVIIAFITKYSVKAVKFIFIKLFKEPFDEIAFSSYLFHDQTNVINFSSYLFSLSLDENVEEAAVITSIFYNCNHTIFPSLSDLTDQTSIPFIISERDIGELFQYFKQIKDIPFNLNPSINKSFDPFMFELFPGCKNSSRNIVYNDDLFELHFLFDLDDNQPQYEGDELECRLWNNVIEDTQKENLSLGEVVKAQIQKYPTKKEFLQMKLYHQYKENYHQLHSSILLMSVLNNLKVMEYSIFFLFSNMIYNLLHDKMGEIIKNDKEGLQIRKRIEKAMKIIEFERSKEIIPKSLFFDFSCCALDTLALSPTKNSEKIEHRFMKILETWVDSNHLILEVGRYGKLSFLLADLNVVGFGKRIRKIVEYMRRFESVFGSEIDEKWLYYFKSLIFSFPMPCFISTFLFVNHFILSSDVLMSYWNPTSKEYWGHLALGIVKITFDDSEFVSLMNDQVFCASLFNIWGRRNETFV